MAGNTPLHVLQKQRLFSPADLRFVPFKAALIPGKVVATIHGTTGKLPVRLSQTQAN
jgi:hypothetical protein